MLPQYRTAVRYQRDVSKSMIVKAATEDERRAQKQAAEEKAVQAWVSDWPQMPTDRVVDQDGRVH